MRVLIVAALAALVLCGCGASAGNWRIEHKGAAWAELTTAETCAVPAVSIAARGDKEVRPADWEKVWPGEFAERFAGMMTDAGTGITATAGSKGALVVKLKLDPFYNGNGYSAFGSNPAHCEATATITTQDGRDVATLRSSARKGDYTGGGPWKAMLGDLGETLAGWIAQQR